MRASFECWCGTEMEPVDTITDEEVEVDLQVECPDCERGYAVTVTRFKGPTD